MKLTSEDDPWVRQNFGIKASLQLTQRIPAGSYNISRLFGFPLPYLPYLPTPPLGQDMKKGQFFKRSLAGLNSEFSFS